MARQEDDEGFRGFPPQTNTNVDVNALLSSMNNLMHQNAAILQLLANQRNEKQSYTVMPDFSKTLSSFSGEDLSQSKSWIEGIESAAMIHNWPAEFKLKTARTQLVGAASSWYEARRMNLLTWDQFKIEFRNTLIHEKNLTYLWISMAARVRGIKEDLSLYFYEKVRFCQELGLSFDEQKEQIAIGLVSRELATMIITKTHLDIDDLYRDLLSYDRINNERRRRHFSEPEKLNRRVTNQGLKPL